MEPKLTNLKSSGHKLTAPRREILKVLSNSPMSALEVEASLLEKKIKADLVTIYRTLELFCDLGLISKVQFEDKIARFELISGSSHHHHLVCIKCGVVEDVEVSEVELTRQIESKSGFEVKRHALEFFGFCVNCREFKN